MKSKKVEKLPDFRGKCLSISLIDDTYSHDLDNPSFQYQGERLFIVGSIPKDATDSNWSKNKQCAIAWDRVKEYIVFDNLNEYKKATKISQKYEDSKK